MDTLKLVETRNVSVETEGTDFGLRVDTVKLVEMGSVSVETKGISRGLEIGLTPRS